MSPSLFSRSQLWRTGQQLEREERQHKVVAETAVANAAALVAKYPHLGGRKGQAYML